MLSRRTPITRLFAAVLCAAAVGCVDGADPTAADTGAILAFSLAPSFHGAPSMAETTGLRRVHVSVTDAATGNVLGASDAEIDPAAPEWRFDLTIEFDAAFVRQVVATVEVSSDIVEWSGRSSSMLVNAGMGLQVWSVDLLRGPLDNVGVTAVNASVPDSIAEGTKDLAGSRLVGGGGGARAFFRSLTPDVVEVTREGQIRGLRPGVGRIEAAAGAVTEVRTVVITPRPVGEEDARTIAYGLSDSIERLVSGLEDAAGAGRIADALSSLATALENRRPVGILDATMAAREALASYGTEATRSLDGPELSLIELVLDYTEFVIAVT